MKKTTLAVVIAIIAVLAVVGLVYSTKKSAGPRIQSFQIETPDISQPIFTATAVDLEKIEIFGESEEYVQGGGVLLATMELVEKNDAGEQTWIAAVPEQQISLKAVYAQGYGPENKKANKISLTTEGSANLNALLWPSTAVPVISGTVKSVTPRLLLLTVPSATSTALNVTLTSSTTVVTAQGKPASISRVRPGTKVNVLGSFIDETHFTAHQIELAP